MCHGFFVILHLHSNYILQCFSISYFALFLCECKLMAFYGDVLVAMHKRLVQRNHVWNFMVALWKKWNIISYGGPIYENLM